MDFFEKAWPLAEGNGEAFTQRSAAERNRLRVFGLIARRKCISQRQLTVTTGLQASTISNITRKLKTLGFIGEGPPLETDRAGPKETELEIIPECAWSLGVNLNAAGHQLVAVNTLGHILKQKSLPPDSPVPCLLEAIPAMIAETVQTARLSPDRFAGVVVGVPGAVNAMTGVVLVSHSLQLREYPLGPLLQAAFAFPVWIERNVACGAYAEHCAGSARNRDSFIYFLLRPNPQGPDIRGLAMVIAEKLYHGCNSASGEIGHHFGTGDLPSSTPADFHTSIANSLADIVNLLDFGCVVISSDHDRLNAENFEHLRALITSRLTPVPNRRFDLLRSELGVNGMVLGCALLALHRGLASRLNP